MIELLNWFAAEPERFVCLLIFMIVVAACIAMVIDSWKGRS